MAHARLLLPIVLVLAACHSAPVTRTTPAPASRAAAQPSPRVTSRAAVQPSSLEAFAGTWNFVGGDAERRALEAEIDAVLAGVPGLMRGRARSGLLKRNPIPPAIRIDPGETLAITMGPRTFSARLGDSPTPVATADRTVQLEHALVNGNLVQRFRDAQGGRTNVFALMSDGTLQLRVEMAAGRLPRSLEYTLTYARAQ